MLQSRWMLLDQYLQRRRSHVLFPLQTLGRGSLCCLFRLPRQPCCERLRSNDARCSVVVQKSDFVSLKGKPKRHKARSLVQAYHGTFPESRGRLIRGCRWSSPGPPNTDVDHFRYIVPLSRYAIVTSLICHMKLGGTTSDVESTSKLEVTSQTDDQGVPVPHSPTADISESRGARPAQVIKC